MSKRIPNETLIGDFVDGEVLRGWQINKLIDVLKKGVNLNKEDIDNIIVSANGDVTFNIKQVYTQEDEPDRKDKDTVWFKII